MDLIPGSGRSPGGGNGKLLQYSCLGNSLDRGGWWATVHGVNASRERGSRVLRVGVPQPEVSQMEGNHKTLKTLLEPADIFSLYPLGEVIILSSASHCRTLRNLIFVPHSPLANPVEGKGPSSFRGLAGAGLRSQGLALREWRGVPGRLLAVHLSPAPVHCPWPLP